MTADASLFEGSPIEGEVSLIAKIDGRRVTILTFTCVPSNALGLAGDDVLLDVPRAGLYRHRGGHP